MNRHSDASRTKQDDSTFRANIQRCSEYLRRARRVLIAAGAGLSVDAGIDYNDPVYFASHFPAMVKRGYRTLYEAMGVHNDWSEALRWGYHAAQVNLVRFEMPPHEVYTTLLTLVEDKDYFVFTSNVDGMFEKSGFARERLYTPQGSYALYQCLTPCSNMTWPIKPVIDRILPVIDPDTQEITDPIVIPRCPNCGESVFANVRGGDWYVEEPYVEQSRSFVRWVNESIDMSLLILEIGAGFNTPGVIRWPMESIAHHIPDAHLIRINLSYPNVPKSLASRATIFQTRGIDVVKELALQKQTLA